jgi:DNA-binding winged helix-turn-helix (wHTH) protein/tetratricopeptide (TPR) repeat protein
MIYAFGECELDTHRGELRRAGEYRHLEPQAYDVLRHLLLNRERLVPKEELFDRVWGGRFVTPGSLNSRLKAVRQAIGDDGKAQQMIRTVRGRGFRFVAPVDARDAPPDQPASPAPGPASSVQLDPSAPDPAPPAAPELIARGVELVHLVDLLDTARAGTRQVAFLTGEPGIGKSTLAEAFLAQVEPTVWVARGQCLEQRELGEPYLPMLDALGRLCRGPGGPDVVRCLEGCAPIWLAQMPALLQPEQRESVQRRSVGATRERMLREIVEALEVLTRDTPLVLLLEDLHWSDASTLDLLVWLAQRSEPARLLVLGTFRPSDADAPLRAAVAQVRRSGRGREIPLRRWSEADVRVYCAQRFPAHPLPESLTGLTHQRTEGNPLFVQMLLDWWIERGALAEEQSGWEATRSLEELSREIPETLRTLVEQRIERLSSDDQQVLEAGSVVGPEFTAALVAAALRMEEEAVEARCVSLARQGQMLRAAGREEWPDGTWTERFAFAHHLFHAALYERIPLARRTRLHRAVGERLEVAHAGNAAARARELAVHFRLGRDDARAVTYLLTAAEQALRRSAHREAVADLTLALDLLRRHADLPDALRLELTLQRMLGPALLLTRGWGDPDAERAYLRAREVSEQLDDGEQFAQVLHGMAYLHEIRGDFHQSQPLLEQALGLRASGPASSTSVEGQEMLACTLFHQGKFASALTSATAAMEAFDPRAWGDPFAASLGMNAALTSHYWAGLALWCLGHPDRAMRPLRAALRIAEESELTYVRAAAHALAAQLFQFRRELAPLVQHADAALRISEHEGYPFPHALALTLRGWAGIADRRTDDGLAQIRRGLAMQVAMGADMERPYGLGLLADALLQAGLLDEGLAAVDEALAVIARRARAFFWEAELHRLRGALLLERGASDAAEESLREALRIAVHQGARSLELRAAMSLCRLEERQGTGVEARERLRSIYDRFAEAHDTPDLRAAAAILRTSA